MPVTCRGQNTQTAEFKSNTIRVVVSSSATYDRTQGAIASLTVGSKLADSDSATTTAITGNNYVTTWNNERR